MAYNDGDSIRGKPAGTAWDTILSSPNDNPERSAVDKTWGLLFDGYSPTERFGQLTRGIANHINDMYAPGKTLAIPPAKMAKFYTTYWLDNEKFPLTKIFQMPHDQISSIYRYLGCQYHLVQGGDLSKTPTIPALTPVGFNRWMTLFVLAYPSEESERLQKVVETMPIDADGVLVERKPERLPKQLSRHLLPLKTSREQKEVLKFELPSFEDFPTSNQTTSKIPIVNSKTFCFPTKHHEDPYSKESATPEDHSAKPNLQPDIPYERHVQFQRHGRKFSRTQPRNGKVYVHNTKYRYNND